jgi:hypothetical protein
VTPDLLDGVRPPKPPEKKPQTERERITLSQQWEAFIDNRTIDDSESGCRRRLDAIDEILAQYAADEEAHPRIRRVWITQ